MAEKAASVARLPGRACGRHALLTATTSVPVPPVPRPLIRPMIVLLKQTGDAPIVKTSKVKIDREKEFKEVVQFLSKQLRRDSVFVYLKNSFSPSLDEKVGVLYDAYATDNMLVVNYSCTPAWG